MHLILRQRLRRIGTRAARFVRQERAASLIEYGLLAALIAVVCIAAVTFLGTETSEKYSEIASDVSESL